MTLTGHSLACKRGENLIFSEINFSVIPGSMCFVKGPNGSGKSTLLRLLAGLLGTAEGRLTLDEIDITNDREIRA
ncbi:MAG: ATP-binding cassette domain-containing protein, partial [Pseudomonadota bacterium]|nr:ATP-binding cassette domain-containing protein [Pseudomonadota bacterium]